MRFIRKKKLSSPFQVGRKSTQELECDRAKNVMICFMLRTGILLDLLVTSFQIHRNLLDFSVALCQLPEMLSSILFYMQIGFCVIYNATYKGSYA